MLIRENTEMSKIAVITDSNSGVTQAQAKELGLFVVPMPFMINEEDYFEDINLTQEQFYEKLEGDANVSTSQPSPDSLLTLWDKVLQDYDQIIYIPMSSGLSGSCQSAHMIAEEEYEGKDKDGVTPKVKVRTYVYARRSVDSIRNGDFKVPEFKKLAQKPVSATPNPFANNGSAPAKVAEPVVTDNSDPFAALDDSECPF